MGEAKLLRREGIIPTWLKRNPLVIAGGRELKVIDSDWLIFTSKNLIFVNKNPTGFYNFCEKKSNNSDGTFFTEQKGIEIYTIFNLKVNSTESTYNLREVSEGAR